MKVAVIPNPTKDGSLCRTEKLCEILKKRGVEVLLNSENMYDDADAAIVLGGDGTMLLAATECAERDIAVMGINLGRVGFMTETEQDNMESAVDKLIKGEYKIEERMMMKVSFETENGVEEYAALNDCVVSKPDAQMINVAVFTDGEKITEYISDGVIIATPTGSTGYSLSAGGPVADPGTEMFLATPICAHTLKARTAVLGPEKKVSVKLMSGANKCADVTVDGVVKGRLEVGKKVEICRFERKFKLIRFGTQSFYDILTAKLL